MKTHTIDSPCAFGIVVAATTAVAITGLTLMFNYNIEMRKLDIDQQRLDHAQIEQAWRETYE